MKNYETEARSRWGTTDAYREHEQKTKNYTKEKWAEANDGMMAIFAEFAVCKNSGASATSAEAQALVAKLQAHITANYYTQASARCTLPTSDSRRISTSMAREQPSLRQRPSQCIAERHNHGIQTDRHRKLGTQGVLRALHR